MARGKTEYCAAHGGGVRCRFPDCNKLAVGAQQLCRTHQNLTKEEQANLPPIVCYADGIEDGSDGYSDGNRSEDEVPHSAKKRLKKA